MQIAFWHVLKAIKSLSHQFRDSKGTINAVGDRMFLEMQDFDLAQI